MPAFRSFPVQNNSTSVYTKQQIVVLQVNKKATAEKSLFTLCALEECIFFFIHHSCMNAEISWKTVLRLIFHQIKAHRLP